MERVMLGMSGGVDSTAAALLLQEAGYDVCGATLLLHRSGEEGCGAAGEAASARRAAERLGIPFFTPDCTEEFAAQVMGDFVSEYRAGRTPNPCVRCNRTVKFPLLLREARRRGCAYIATGHYARVRRDEASGRWQLLRGTDRSKDQSYVLYPLSQEILSRLLLPVGTWEKPALRAMAAERGMENAMRRDSQDICFIPDGDYAAFLERQGVSLEPGDFVDRQGYVLGRHRGLERYTLGQRRGLGVSGGRPLYVVEKRLEENQVVLGDEEDLYTGALRAEEFNWVSLPPQAGPIAVTARTRYSQGEAEALATPQGDGSVLVEFAAPQRAVTAGQSVVLYQGELVVGGGVIARRF